ncbi:hypothetical protein NDU88_006793 [Pleurodeles waltl]|uniref:Uncharacterized protein n=1 Tax=Pleurodeles waltl TaxID=8319 RepID=A0AAV7QM72_PLEWA|nr:hypothetical protein NDU88_006793 [Pleurodeles waltl]
MFFPDYTVAVQKQRNSFLAVKQDLCEMEFTYSLLFPAKLSVVTADTTHFFATTEEAWHWIETSDGGATSSLRLELPGGSAAWRRRGQRRIRAQKVGNLPAVPDLEQRIQERHNALQQAAVLSNIELYTSLEGQGSHFSNGERSAVTWPSLLSLHKPPDVTLQMSDILL